MISLVGGSRVNGAFIFSLKSMYNNCKSDNFDNFLLMIQKVLFGERFVKDKVHWMFHGTPYYTMHPVIDTEDNYSEKYRYRVTRGQSLISSQKQMLESIQSEHLRDGLWISVQIIYALYLQELFGYKTSQLTKQVDKIFFGSSCMSKQEKQLAQKAEKMYQQIFQVERTNCDQPETIVQRVLQAIQEHKDFKNINKKAEVSLSDQQLKQRFIQNWLPNLRESLKDRISCKIQRRLQLASQQLSPILNTQYDHHTGALFVDRFDTTEYQLMHNFERISYRVSGDKLSQISKMPKKTLEQLHKSNEEKKSIYEDIYNNEQNIMTLEVLLKKMAHSTATASQHHDEMMKLKGYLIVDLIEQIMQYQRLMHEEYPIITSKNIIYNTRSKKFSLTLQNIILKGSGVNLNDGLSQPYMFTQNNYFSNKGRNTSNYDQLLIVLDYFSSHCCYDSNEKNILESRKQIREYGEKLLTQEILNRPTFFQGPHIKQLHNVYTAKLSALKHMPLYQLFSKPQNPELSRSFTPGQTSLSLPHFLEIDKSLGYKSRITQMPRKCRQSNILWLQIKVYDRILQLQHYLQKPSILNILHFQKFLKLFQLFQLCPKARTQKKIYEQAEKAMKKIDGAQSQIRLYTSQSSFFKKLLVYMKNNLNIQKSFTYYSEDQLQKIAKKLHTEIKRLPNEIKPQEKKQNALVVYGLVSLQVLLSLNINHKNCEIIQYHVLSLVCPNDSSNLTTNEIEQRIIDLVSLSDRSSF